MLTPPPPKKKNKKKNSPSSRMHENIRVSPPRGVQQQIDFGVDGDLGVPRLTGKTRITGKTTEIPERPKNNRGLFPVLILLALFV